jgi:hypothetical protein
VNIIRRIDQRLREKNVSLTTRGDSGKKNHVGKKNQSIIFYFKFAAALFLCISVSDSHSAVFDVRNVKVSYFFHDLRPKQRVCRC